MCIFLSFANIVFSSLASPIIFYIIVYCSDVIFPLFVLNSLLASPFSPLFCDVSDIFPKESMNVENDTVNVFDTTSNLCCLYDDLIYVLMAFECFDGTD